MVDTPTTNYGWIMPGDHVNTNTWGAILNTDLQAIDTTVYANQQAIASINLGYFTSNQIILNKQTVPPGNVIFGSYIGTPRWTIDLGDGTAEAGSNAGSNFTITNFSDAGAVLNIPLAINRATSASTFSGALSCAGAATFSLTLSCTGAATFSSTLSCTGNATFGGTLACTGAATLSSTLACTGVATFSGALSCAAQASLNTVLVTQGLINIVKGTATNPALLLNDGTSNRSSLHFNTGLNRTQVSDLVAGGSLEIDAAANFLFEGSGLAFKTGGGSWSVLSDARTKTVIGDYKAGLDEVLQLRPISYVYKGNDAPPGQPSPTLRAEGKAFVGFVAQELETVMPDMVSRHDGFIDGQKVTDMRAVDVSELVFALVNCVKALKAEIDELKS